MKKWLALMLALAMVLSLAACGSTGQSSSGSGAPSDSGQSSGSSDSSAAVEQPVSGEPVYGGKAVVHYGDSLLAYFDPAMADNRNYSLWLECLFGYDWGANSPENGASSYVNYTFYSGQIAKDEYDVDYDAGTVTVYIRDDVYFQDKVAAGFEEEYDIFGARQLTASDVAYSYQRLLGIDGVTATENSEIPWAMQLPAITHIEADDATGTVVFHIDNLTEVTLDSFITNPVNITGPEWDELTPEQQSDWHYACGTGPYILSGFEMDASMSFVKSTNYYDYDERYPENKLPYLDEVEYVQITDSANVLTQFMSGQLDIISFGNDILSSSEQATLRESMGEGNYIEYNYGVAPRGLSGHYNLTDTPLGDVNVRIALQHAIDVASITQAMYGTDEVEYWGLWTPETNWSSGAIDEAVAAGEYDYDPELAKTMLEEAGYPDGFEFTFYMMSDADISQIAQMVAACLAQVGVTMNIQVVSSNELDSYIADKTMDCAVMVNRLGAQAKLSFATMNAFPGGGGYMWNIPVPEYDELAAAMTAATTLEDQANYAAQLDDIYVQQHALIVAVGAGQLHQFYSAKLGGLSGEQYCCNLNGRTIISRIWSNTGE